MKRRETVVKELTAESVLTSAEVGVLFGVGARTVRQWCMCGMIKYFRTLGGHIRIEYKDIAYALEDPHSGHEFSDVI